MDWSPASWRRCEARQQPDYRDPDALAAAERALAARPPLVSIAAIDALTSALAEAQAGRAFLLQGGDCAERLAEPPEAGAATAALLAAMGREAGAAAGLPAILVGRLAGQYAKPRSEPLERRGATALPAWRGDIVNDAAFDAQARSADPARMPRAYDAAAATLARLRGAPVFAGHEALLLSYEQALVRRDPASGRFYGGSGHFLWIGERTRFEGSAHVELVRGLANPIGVKCGPTLGPDALARLLDRLNPAREPGRITLIARMGSGRIEARLPPLLRAARRAGHPVLWCCDPMHGNTRRAPDGRKARPPAAIFAEARAFFALAAAEGAHPGGLHVEMTAEPVEECAPGPAPLAPGRAGTPGDPRLNAAQALALARLAGEELARARATMTPRRASA